MSTETPQITPPPPQQQQIPSTLPPQQPLNIPTNSANKIAVVGGGISGISTAYYLQQQGHDVVLIESLDDVAKGATKVSVPLLKRYQESILNFDVYDKIKSKFCPVRMFTRAQKLANNYSHRSFHDAYGWDIARLAFDQEQVVKNNTKLSLLTQSNYNEALELIRKEHIPLNLTPGHLYVTDDRAKKGDAILTYRQFKSLYKDCDIFKLTRDEPSWLFPSLQQDHLDLYGGMYTPSTVIFHPTTFAQQLKEKMEGYNTPAVVGGNTPVVNPTTGRPYGHVDFLFNAKATGFTVNEKNDNISAIHITQQQEVPLPPEIIEQHKEEQAKREQHLAQVQQAHDDAHQPILLPGANAGQLPMSLTTRVDSQEFSLPIDKVVLCNGYQAFQITEHLDQDGPLLQVIPVKSVSFDVYDKTRARFDRTVPTLFPTHPISYYPEDQEFTRVQAKWEMDVRAAGLNPHDIYSTKNKHPLLQPPKVDPLTVEEIHRDYTSPQPVPYSGIGAVEFASCGLTLIADQHNPRHFFGYLGRDMAEISDQVSDKHLDNVLDVLESIRKIPEGATIDIDVEKDRRVRRPANHKAKGSRHFSMQPSSMALHTIGRDGLPVIGPAPKVNNLFFNTGHGVSPQNTAIIGGKMVAEYCSAQELTERMQKKARDDELLRAEKKEIPFTPLTDQDFIDINTALGIRSVKEYMMNKLTTNTKQVYNEKAPSFLKKTLEEVDFTKNENLQSYIRLDDYLPTRWGQHNFTPSWFDGAQLTRQQQQQVKQQQAASLAAKREMVQAAKTQAKQQQQQQSGETEQK